MSLNCVFCKSELKHVREFQWQNPTIKIIDGDCVICKKKDIDNCCKNCSRFCLKFCGRIMCGFHEEIYCSQCKNEFNHF